MTEQSFVRELLSVMGRTAPEFAVKEAASKPSLGRQFAAVFARTAPEFGSARQAHLDSEQDSFQQNLEAKLNVARTKAYQYRALWLAVAYCTLIIVALLALVRGAFPFLLQIIAGVVAGFMVPVINDLSKEAVGRALSGRQALSASGVRLQQSRFLEQVREIESRFKAEAKAEGTHLPMVIAGQWIGSEGTRYSVKQHGNHIILIVNSSLGITAYGEGRVSDSHIALEYRAIDDTQGHASLRIRNQDLIEGEFKSPYGTSITAKMTRSGFEAA